MLNIKDPETHRLARELADLEHTTLTGAVNQALRAALAEHSRRRQMRRQVLEGLVAAARSEGVPGADPFADLYEPVTGLLR
jgi:hypothetical protein